MRVIETNLDYTAPPCKISDENGRLAEIIASRQFPGSKLVNSDDTFMGGRRNHEDLAKLPDCLRDKLLDEAKAKGVNVKGKVYCDQIAKYPNDPFGWVSGADELVSKVKSIGKNLEGSVNC